MKLRIRGNSIRLRLTQTEVNAVGSDGACIDVVRFSPASALTYRLEAKPDCAGIGALFASGEITVTVPASQLAAWATSDEVSLRAEQANGDEAPLTILIEKDFACLAPREGEDESDMYPHPETIKIC